MSDPLTKLVAAQRDDIERCERRMADLERERDEARRLAEYWRERAMGDHQNAEWFPLPWESGDE
jgi:hypothetical protein